MKGNRFYIAVVAILVLIWGFVFYSTYGADIGRATILAQPLDGWNGVTSNTAELFGFYSARRSGYNPPVSTGDWTTTQVQYLADGTVITLYRNPLRDWLEITNLTTYTLYITLNCGWQPVADTSVDYIMNETTPTLGLDTYQFRLYTTTSGMPFRLNLWRSDDPLFFPIENVGVYFYDSSTDYYTSAAIQTNVTSQTLRILGH